MSPSPNDASAGGALLPPSCDVAIVGAGSAGIAAATLAAELGVDALLLDEPGASVCGVQNVADGFELCVALGRKASMVQARCVILAVGVLEQHQSSAPLVAGRAVPEIHLADMLGCDMAWDDVAACWMPRIDEWGASSVGHVFIAGGAAGIAGTNAAAHHGALAALAAATTLGRIDTSTRDASATVHRLALAQALRDYRPPERYRVPQDEAIACPCENVTAREVIAAVHEGCTGPNQLKAFTRCGMGPCQGRDCGLAITEIIAHERGVHPSTVGRFRARFPARPLTLGQLASLPSSVADRNAVTRWAEDD